MKLLTYRTKSAKLELQFSFLNEATQAWVEGEYNHSLHRELATSPAQVVLTEKSVGRESEPVLALRQAFTRKLARVQRKSDGTLTVNGVRFEIPSVFRHLKRVVLRVADWDLSQVWMVDPVTDALGPALYPLDKQRNAEAARAPRVPVAPVTPPSGLPPLMQKLLREYAQTGLPPAYIPFQDEPTPPLASESHNA